MPDKILHKGKFVELKLREEDDYKYEFLHESRCDGNIVAILPVHKDNGYLVRHEFTPCWGEGLNVSSITGGWEKDRHPTPIDTVLEELREEAGIVLNDETAIKSLGTCRGTKSSDTLYHLFIVELEDGNYDEVPIEGDGGSLEARAHNQWYKTAYKFVANGVDPMLFVIYARMQMLLDEEVNRDSYK
jgi:hypothetical protein